MALSSEGQLAIGEGSKLGNERRLRCDHVQFPEHSQYTMSRGNYLEPLLTTVHQIGLGENPISQALNHVSHSQLRAMLLVVSEVRRPHSSLHARSVWRRLRTKARAGCLPPPLAALTFCVFWGTLAGAHLSVPRRKIGQSRAHDGRDWSQHPARHVINSLAVRGGDQHT
jgi:hypothetical protein